MNPSSAIYECSVMHHRLVPKKHRFDYNLFYLWLDLDDLDGLSSKLRFFSRNRWNLFSFHDADHLIKGHADTKSNILAILRESGVDTESISRIRLLTLPRILGYIFNPVCFYYCFDADDKPVCALAEVTNTYHEQKPYVLTHWEDRERFRLITPKHFYVSPFIGLEVNFDFKLQLPDERLKIQVNDRVDDHYTLLSNLTGTRRPLTDGALLWCAIKYPLLTLKVILLIHWHALRLWLTRLPVHAKAARPDLQRGVHRPHSSIAHLDP